MTALDGKPMKSIEAVIAYVSTKAPGQRVTVGYVRGSSSHTVSVTLDDRPATARSGG